MRVATTIGLSTLLLASCAPAGGLCSADALANALATAAPSSTVQIGACTIEGAFVVPAGVSLRGMGPTSVLGSIASGGPVLDVAAGTSHIEDLTVHVAHGSSGVRAVAASDLRLAGLDVAVDVGIGIGVEGGTLTLEDVTLRGPITHANAGTASSDPSATGAWGVIVRDVTSSFTGVHVSGFSVGGVAIDGGALDWTDIDDATDIGASRGAGLVAFGADVALHGVEIADVLSGLGVVGMAIASASSASSATPMLTLVDTHVAAGAGYGIVAFDTVVSLEHVGVDGVGLVGLQAQRGTLDATDVTMNGNGGAGIALLDVASIRIHQATLSAQRTVSLPTDVGTASFGDGLHVRRTSSTSASVDLVVDDVMLENNPRAGLLLDADDGTLTTLTLTNVRAGATDPGALGVIAQRTTVPSGWDSGVVRTGTPLTNDATFTGQIDTVGLLMPPTSLPSSLF